MFAGNILRHQPRAAAKLGIAENTVRADDSGIVRTGTEYGLEYSGCRVEAVVIFGGPKRVLIEASLRCERQSRRRVVICVYLHGVVLRAINRVDLGFDHAQVSGLGGAFIG